MSKTTPISRQLGHVLAYVQHGIDKTIVWGFRRMKKASKDSSEKCSVPAKKGALRRIGTLGRHVLGFISNAGEAYYDRYDELKRK